MTDTAAPRTETGTRLVGHHIYLTRADVLDIEREAIEPLLALVRAAERWEGLEVSRRITDYGDGYYDDLEQSAGEAASALIETVRALPESVRVAVRKPE